MVDAPYAQEELEHAFVDLITEGSRDSAEVWRIRPAKDVDPSPRQFLETIEPERRCQFMIAIDVLHYMGGDPSAVGTVIPYDQGQVFDSCSPTTEADYLVWHHQTDNAASLVLKFADDLVLLINGHSKRIPYIVVEDSDGQECRLTFR